MRLNGRIQSKTGSKAMTYSSCKYTGEIDLDSKACGVGQLATISFTYKGMWKDDSMHGFGVCEWISGSREEG